jgi:hypothetical protein
MGAFSPDKESDANNYLSAMRKKEPSTTIELYRVSNLNQFLANLKYGKSS